MLPTESSGGNKLKSFWERPEGTTGMIFTAALIIGGCVGLYHLLPFIITLLANTLHALLLAGAVGGILVLVTNKRFRTLCWYMFKSAMRALTGLVIMIDPIAITKSYIEDLHKRKKKLKAQIGDLAGEIQKLRNIINTNKESADKNLSMVNAIKKSGDASDKRDQAQVMLKARRASRLKESNLKYRDLLARMEKLHSALDDMYYYSGIFIDDLEDEVKQREIEYKMVKKSHSVLKSAVNILNNNDDKAEVFRQSMEFMMDDIQMKVGQMEEFMDSSADFIHSVDIENGVFLEEGLQMLDVWEEKGIDNIFGADATAENAAKHDNRSGAAKQIEENAYSKFFDK